MELELKRDLFRLRSSVLATPGDYDAYPLFREIQISAVPQTVHPDRAAVACTLLFSSSVAGSFAMQPGCSPLASSAIREWFAPGDVHVLSVDFQPSRITAGETTINVLAEGVNNQAAPVRSEGSIELRVLGEGASFLASPDEFALVSNAILVPDAAAPDLERILPAIGVSVLFSEDFFARTICVPGIRADDERELWDKLRLLLDSVGLWLAEGVGDDDEQ